MKASRITVLLLILLAPHIVTAQKDDAAERAWEPFFNSFRAAVKSRDRKALKKMMTRDFYFSAGGGDDDHDGDTRDEAFEFWDDKHVRGWEALDRILAQGTVPMASWWDGGRKRKFASRVAPPAANVRRNMKRAGVEWYAVFEFRGGQWYCTIFNECCD
jgi:hypothetical protein